MIKQAVSFLSYYLNFFGDHRHQFVDLTPEHDTGFASSIGLKHIGLEERFTHRQPTPEEIAKMDEYAHPCWCNPELIYADDLRGNEVWLHKPIQ